MPIALNGLAPYRTIGRVFGLVAALAVALSLGATGLPAAAQQQSAPAEYTDEDLEAFAAASQRVQELNQKWIPQISQAETAEENAALRERAMQEMTAAVRDEGLTIDEYNRIFDAAERNPEVMQQIEDHRESQQ